MSRLGGLPVADRYREVAGRFGALVADVRDWDAPAPVDGWRARDVVGHLTGWFPPMLEGGCDVRLEPLPSAEDDPAGAWAALDGQLRDLLADPAGADVVHVGPHTGRTPLPELVDRYFTTDIFMHTWDLARATGQPDRLDEEHAAEVLAGMQGMEQVLRDSGQFGQQQPVPEDADATDRLIAFIGRDPRWRP